MTARRHLLQAALAAPLLPWARLAVAQGAPSDANRFVFVILRGGLDGLTAVPAIGDAAFAEARGPLGRFEAFNAEPQALDATFALHPLLPQLHTMYRQRELLVLHATGLPYRERSHFDAQQVLESGGVKPYELSTGWLARALAGVAATPGRPPLRAVALETAVPLVLRGGPEVDSWAPSTLPEPNADLVARLQALMHRDEALATALARARGLRDEPGMAANPMAGAGGMGSMAPGGRGATALTLARKAAEFLQRGSQVAVLEMGGWDSHTNQALPGGATSNNLRALDAALAALREGLLPGDTWRRTAVLVATEFGREVAVNGNQGTDHGSGGAAFVLGGAVRGGRVLADWPGLAPRQRHEGRDLKVTTDLRAVMRTLLAQHLGVPRRALDAEVLPGSAGLPALDLLS